MPQVTRENLSALIKQHWEQSEGAGLTHDVWVHLEASRHVLMHHIILNLVQEFRSHLHEKLDKLSC